MLIRLRRTPLSKSPRALADDLVFVFQYAAKLKKDRVGDAVGMGTQEPHAGRQPLLEADENRRRWRPWHRALNR